MEEKRITDLVFIVDKSGSMASIRKATIKAFNEILETQKKQAFDDEARITFAIFNDQYERNCLRASIEEVPVLSLENYNPTGCTALNDAVGKTICDLQEAQKADVGREIKTLVCVLTDGLENSSREFSRTAIKALIQAKKAEGWEFLFVGSEFDVEKEAQTFGFSEDEAFCFEHNEKGFKKASHAIAKCCECARSAEPRKRSVFGK